MRLVRTGGKEVSDETVEPNAPSLPGYDNWLEPDDEDGEREDCSYCDDGTDPRYGGTCSHCHGRGWVPVEPEEEEPEEVEEEEEEEVKPNRGSARPLGNRSSMKTEFGRDVDPDRYEGRRGAALDGAMKRYEVFHAKRPLRVVDLGHELPTQLVPIGQCISTMYRTDKWHKDGVDEDYKHVHDDSSGGRDKEYDFGKGVTLYEPAREASRSKVEGRRSSRGRPGKTVKLPVPRPEALTMLGYCLGVFVQRFDDQEFYEVNPRGCYLMCSPSGDMLAVYSPEKQPDGSSGFLMIMAGGGLRVLKDGIDG